MPLSFSIVTCTWNSAQFLPESMASLLAQDYPHVEIIFVDGGSTDGTLEQIRALDRPYRLIENVRGGVSNAMNEGIRAATGDVIAHLHSDDFYLHPAVLSTVARHLESSGKKWLFGRMESVIDGKLVPESYTAPRFSYRSLLKSNFIPHPSTFVRRDLLQQAGGFDTKLKYAMDYDLWLRLARLCEPVQLDEALAAFREHDGGLSTANRVAAMEEDFRVRMIHAGKDPVSKLIRYARYVVRRQRAMQAEAAK